MVMEVEWREEKGAEGAEGAIGARPLTRVISPLTVPLAVEATIGASVRFVAKIEMSAMIARVCLNTSRTGMESELGREW